MKRAWILLFFMCLLGYSIGVQNYYTPNTDGIVKEAKKDVWVDSVMNSLSLDQKIAQFFMIGAYPTQGETNKTAVKNLISKYNVGGVLFFKGTANEIASWSNEFQAVAQTPLFVSIDGEWGINMRVENTIQWPRQLTLGAIQDDDLIFQMGQHIANECKTIGVNIDFAPVIDINNNINNPVIGDRSFGEDKFNVALKGLAYAQGLQSNNVMAVGKHFPGHGDTDTDSHADLPVIKHSFHRLDSLELYPFKVAIENNVMGIMVAHLNIPALDKTPNLASSLSKKVVQGLLIDSLGFKGLVFTDALNMQGASKYFEPGEIDLKAFLAGNDILLVPADLPTGIKYIKNAISKGTISKEYIDERLRKVLEHKYALNLTSKIKVDESNLSEKLNTAESNVLNKTLFQKAITLVANDNAAIPINSSMRKETVSVAMGTGNKQNIQNTLETYGIVSKGFIPNDISNTQASTYVSKYATAKQVIVSIHNMSRWKSKNFGFTDGELSFLTQLSKKTKVILVVFGSPYSLSKLQDFGEILLAYEDNSDSQEAAALALIDKLEITGKLPVSVGKFAVNSGVDISKNPYILNYANPEDVGMDMKRLDSIAYYAQKAIKINATPGCQILVAKDGKIIYEKGFGYTTYTSNNAINANTIYDLASVTKVAATTLSIMKLYEDGKVSVDKSIQDYLPEYKNTSVGRLVIRDVMAHQAGLPAWIPFYSYTIEDSVYNNWYSVDSNAAYCVKVADGLYMCKDSTGYIWKTISDVTIKENPDYKYSDLGFYLLMQVVEKQSGETLDKFVDETYYKPMGLQNIGFNPLEKFDLDRIPPTEDDTIFRKQEVQGYVHDPGAAMLGGVSGHAGLFSNARDLAALFQMLINKGTYNQQQFLQPETIDYFNTLYFKGNRRALGFDKPVEINEKTGRRSPSGPTYAGVSDACFGHTGFTGTCVWADPEYNLVYVFLSNRTYPYANDNKLAKENIRTDIQGVIYRAMK